MQASWYMHFVGFALALIAVQLHAAMPEVARRQLILQTPPAASVNSVTVSPDGSLVATAAGEGGVRLYDAQTGVLLRTIGGVGDRCVVFSPDGRLITAAGFHMDKLVGVYDVKTGRKIMRLDGQTEWEADATAISPDGKLLASTATDMQILIWELETGKLRHQFKDRPTRSAALMFSPDSTILATGGGDRLIHLWDMKTGKLRQSLAGHRDWICSLAFSPDGRFISSASCDWGFHRGHDWPRPAARGKEQSEWRLWELASASTKRTVTFPGQMLSLAFAPDGKSIACTIDNDVRLYDLSSESRGRVIATHDATVTSVAFSPDGAAVFSASHDQTVKRTAVATGTVQWQAPGYFEQVNSVAFSDDGSVLVTGTSDQRFARGRLLANAREIGPGAVRIWDMHTGRMLRRLDDSVSQIMAVDISRDGKFVASGGAHTSGAGVVGVWNAASGDAVWALNDHDKEVLSVALAPDGKLVASGAADGMIKLRDAQSGAAIHHLPGNAGGATSLVFSPDCTVLYCGAGHGATRAWDVKSGKLLFTCRAPGSQAESHTINRLMSSIGLSRDGSLLATCNSDVNSELVDPVRIWDARSGAVKRDFSAENIHGRPMALSPDGSLIATGGKSVKLWDVRTGQMVRELNGPLKRTQSIVFSADGRRVASGGSYGTTNIWDVATGQLLVTLYAFTPSRIDGATDQWFAYHPDGYFDGSPSVEKLLAWRVGDELHLADALASELRRPERIRSALAP
jgi:WD40 repeat protein